jgi:hypothetical protein
MNNATYSHNWMKGHLKQALRDGTLAPKDRLEAVRSLIALESALNTGRGMEWIRQFLKRALKRQRVIGFPKEHRLEASKLLADLLKVNLSGEPKSVNSTPEPVQDPRVPELPKI